ncbi:MAG: hypothetical protein COB26_10965 [Piscirickettsiaceae bacterium]|nr:MAG: hypothetical protein COB26_10965 [Piscirickettsiaceae bacterium]
MGALGNQPAREQYRTNLDSISYFIEDAAELAKKHNVKIEVIVNAKHALELERQNNIAIQNGDFTDEQAAGIGEILSRIATAIESNA